ncbi:MAG TPA: zinc ribbon domain-containing protein [Phycisphaerales bacterium]|nr:zinc ribbon domain-containing protein [Phycisphaerales bacterium]HCD32694.1 zinc ribbon domain-containing protein [Phycisphaerales bacterium]
MPVYEYRCHDCGHLTEELRTMSAADEPVVCGECQSKDTSRVQSVFSASGGSSTVPDCCPVGPMTGGGCCGGGACGHQH